MQQQQLSSEAIQQQKLRAIAAANELNAVKMELVVNYGAMLAFPPPPTLATTAAGVTLSTDPAAIAKEWEVRVEGCGSDTTLPTEWLGWPAVMGSMGMRLAAEQDVMARGVVGGGGGGGGSQQQQQQGRGRQLLGVGCFSVQYTQPYFDVIATQFRKPEYVPQITLRIQPVSQPNNGNATSCVRTDATINFEGPLLQTVSNQVLGDFIEAEAEKRGETNNATTSNDANTTIMQTLATRLTPSYAPFGIFDHVSTEVTLPPSGANTASSSGSTSDFFGPPIKIQQQPTPQPSSTSSPTLSSSLSSTSTFTHFRPLLVDRIPDRSTITTTCFGVRNGFAFSLTLEAMKGVYERYVHEVIGPRSRIGMGIAIGDPSRVFKGLKGRVAQRDLAALKEAASARGSGENEITTSSSKEEGKEGGGETAASSLLLGSVAGQSAVLNAFRYLTTSRHHGLATLGRADSFLNDDHRRIVRRLPTPTISGAPSSSSPLSLFYQTPLEWMRVAKSEVGACDANSDDNKNGSVKKGGGSRLFIDPSTKRIALLSSEKEKNGTFSLEPIDAIRAVFGKSPSSTASPAPSLAWCYIVESFVTTPNGYVTNVSVLPEIVTLVVGYSPTPTASRSSTNKGKGAKPCGLPVSSSSEQMAERFSKALLSSAGDALPSSNNSSISSSSKWVEDCSQQQDAGQQGGGEAEGELVCRRFLLWKRVSMDNEPTSGNGGYVDFITDECRVYYYRDAGAVSSPSSPASIAIVRTIRPFDYHMLLVPSIAPSQSTTTTTTTTTTTITTTTLSYLNKPSDRFITPKGLPSATSFYCQHDDTTAALGEGDKAKKIVKSFARVTTHSTVIEGILKSAFIYEDDNSENDAGSESFEELLHFGQRGFQIKVPQQKDGCDSNSHSSVNRPLALHSFNGVAYFPLGRMLPYTISSCHHHHPQADHQFSTSPFSNAFAMFALISTVVLGRGETPAGCKLNFEKEMRRYGLTLPTTSSTATTTSSSLPPLQPFPAPLSDMGLVGSSGAFSMDSIKNSGRWDGGSQKPSSATASFSGTIFGSCSMGEAINNASIANAFGDGSSSSSSPYPSTAFISRLREAVSAVLANAPPLANGAAPQSQSPSTQTQPSLLAAPTVAVPILWHCYYYAILPSDPNVSGRVQLPQTHEDAALFFSYCTCKMLLVPSFADANNEVMQNKLHLLPACIRIEWNFAENFEWILQQNVLSRSTRSSIAQQQNHNRGGPASDGSSSSISPPPVESSPIPTMWGSGRAAVEQFVKDWSFVKRLLFGGRGETQEDGSANGVADAAPFSIVQRDFILPSHVALRE